MKPTFAARPVAPRRPGHRSWWANPFYRFGALTLGPACFAALLVAASGKLSIPAAWILSINAIAFLTYGYDKAIAGSEHMRVPEAVLLGLALVGGTLGAIAAMLILRHKTAKASFRSRLLGVVIAQGLLVGTYLWLSGVV